MRDKTIDYILKSTWIAVTKMYNEEAAKKGSTMSTGFALLSIDPEKGTPSTALGPKMGVESTSLSRTLKNMQDKGLITRTKNPKDGRSVLIHLTDFGLDMRDFSKEVVLGFDQAVKENIPQEKLDTFLEVAEKIQDMITEKSIYKNKVYKNA
ncbi:MULTISPECIES: MarR family winged helix-turn-helix transcriptional regulator [Psychroflexus]|uniref:DNA-binding transcriptional regulator, MarR family n=1 Tax=Psychroflexus halocasei TaxID=908615 RepID=A0A1H3Y1X2_9FLAO|nr:MULTISPECIES: MarR family transcriptional regulator [Psychroflexus]PJX24671.1 MarR family transcriptional regulator [Psychroflexus sp. S27]SEA05735.1 DNA-binding transcriptional regulator, MarR family [Psychroflexus halocasei]